MRLLHTKELRLEDFVPQKAPKKYAILSHMWENQEVTLQAMEKGVASNMEGYAKLKRSCQKAAEDGYEWIWIDTCCIDKTSSAELSEAINSMFTYYGSSTVCYAYLADVKSLEDFQDSRWFARGWTLQELLAPRNVRFFDSSWRELGTKRSFSQQIFSRTGIPVDILLGKSIKTCNAAQRMSWASQRDTTREEDIAYCLMGIFDVQMSPIYGEGAQNAFLRLQSAILSQNADHTLFIWTPKHDPYNQGLLAGSPRAFCTHYECFTWITPYIRFSGGPFDPYGYLRRTPSNTLKQVYKFSTQAGRDWHEAGDDEQQYIPVSASLGQSGLHISPLSHIKDDNNPDSRRLGSKYKIIMLDILVVGSRAKHFILLKLKQEATEIHYFNNYALSRLGDWSRQLYIEDDASCFLDHMKLSFKRGPISVSQTQIPVPYAGPPVTFTIGTQPRSVLVSKVLFPDSNGSLVILSQPTIFSCIQGLIVLKHLCKDYAVRYEQRLILCFGGHDEVYRPWCSMFDIYPSGDDDSSMRAIYAKFKSHAYRSGRFISGTKIYLSCNDLINAQIDYQEDVGVYCINFTSELYQEA